ncbi:MAG: HlyD family secretion protein [Burkholderiales bacterium]|nr:HlyD family secretion protein [Burkholderiales bacterium]
MSDDDARASADTGIVAPSPSPPASRRKIARLTVTAIVAIAAAFAGVAYWLHARGYASTDDAYVNANTVDIAAQVPGQVTAIYIRDQQHVAAGDPLFAIDPRSYEAAVAKAQAQLALARQSVRAQEAEVAVARAQLAQRQAEEADAGHVDERTQTLVRSGFISKQGGDNAHTQLLTAQAAVRAAQATLAQKIDALGAAGDANAAVRAAEATLAQARLDLDHTKVQSPASGHVANLSLRPGATVAPGTPLFSIVSDDEFWIDANFKETELARVRPGQKARITVDMYPDHPFEGVVESVSPGSGAAFSLLPPQNATGNWVKVTQRVPVRVRVIHPDPAYALRIGTTATVRVALR